jgi:hypothetical protein
MPIHNLNRQEEKESTEHEGREGRHWEFMVGIRTCFMNHYGFLGNGFFVYYLRYCPLQLNML